MKKAEQFIDELIQQHALPPGYSDLVGEYLWPLVQEMALVYKKRTKTESNTHSTSPWMVGLQGTQGSGKSTVCLFIKALLEKCYELNVVILSIDDFYKTREERIQLSNSEHPLLITRGVPGTHDIDLTIDTLNTLSNLTDGESCSVPSFNKVFDDRTEKSDWPKVHNKVDVILFEGWCMGVSSQTQTEIIKPINELEKVEDSGAIWRTYVNDQLANEYNELFSKIENLIVLQAPSFTCVYQWRLLQETKLANHFTDSNSKIETRIQTPEQIERFISHYERLTRHALKVLSKEASWVISLDDKHNMISLIRNDHLLRLD